MFMNKLIICVDGNGHFHAANPFDRVESIRMLKLIEDGDFWANEITHSVRELLDFDDEHWMSFLVNLQQRGRMEIIDYNPSVL